MVIVIAEGAGQELLPESILSPALEMMLYTTISCPWKLYACSFKNQPFKDTLNFIWGVAYGFPISFHLQYQKHVKILTSLQVVDPILGANYSSSTATGIFGHCGAGQAVGCGGERGTHPAANQAGKEGKISVQRIRLERREDFLVVCLPNCWEKSWMKMGCVPISTMNRENLWEQKNTQQQHAKRKREARQLQRYWELSWEEFSPPPLMKIVVLSLSSKIIALWM